MKIVDSDAFLEMPLSAQALYFHLNMRADDDGFCDKVSKTMRMIKASKKDLSLLLEKRFVIMFENGVIVIKHWRMHNALSTNRYHETPYIEEKSLLRIKENGAYSLNSGREIDDTKYVDIGKRQNRHDKDVSKTNADIEQEIEQEIEQILEEERDKEGDREYNCLPIRKEVVSYLNEKLGTRYRHDTESTKRHVDARIKEGRTIEDFKCVIDKKVAEWKGDARMSKYLRPETLFGTKFESYLNQVDVGEKSVYNEWGDA